MFCRLHGRVSASKSIRFNLINLPGRVKKIKAALVRLTKGHSSNGLMWQAKERLSGGLLTDWRDKTKITPIFVHNI